MLGIWPPFSWAYNQDVDDIAMNANISACLTDLAGPMDTYAPFWAAATTNPVVNNGTLTGKFRQAYKAVDFAIALTMGSSTTYGTGGGWNFTLPVPPDPSFNYEAAGLIIDVSTGDNYLICADTVGIAGVLRIRLIGTLGLLQGVTATAPMIFATGDRILISGRYWAA